jgi:hypothetical protein
LRVKLNGTLFFVQFFLRKKLARRKMSFILSLGCMLPIFGGKTEAKKLV